MSADGLIAAGGAERSGRVRKSGAAGPPGTPTLTGPTGPRHLPAPPPPPEEFLPCPCRGHQALGELWAYEICPVCYWEENHSQLRHRTSGGGPNHGLSLIEAQADYRRIGAVTKEMRRHVRPPRDDGPPDPGFRPAAPGFRPAAPGRDPFEQGLSHDPIPDDLATPSLLLAPHLRAAAPRALTAPEAA